ncbi:MAG: GDCCVxC domain-containing (seleno)protein [Gemmatimonadaceae bacterium]
MTIEDSVQLLSTIRCPRCGGEREERMPTGACQFFYQCTHCGEVLRPLAGDCCVFCSYGTARCPSMQAQPDRQGC